jgi:hypothetical protein
MSDGPPCGNNPNFRMSPGDRAVVEEFMEYLALRSEARAADQGNEEPMQYLLTRTLPSGEEKSHRPLGTLREVEFAAAYCLMDTSRVPRGEARRFAHGLTGQPLGTTVAHAGSGYAFRVDRA